MKNYEFRHNWCSLFVLFCVTTIGCTTPPALKMPEQFSPIVRQYKHVTIAQWRSGLVDTGIYLNKGDFFTVLTDGFYKRYYMRTVIGEEWVPSDPYHRNSPVSGSLSFGCYENIGVSVDIFVWDREDFDQIAAVLGEIREENPKNDEVIYAVEELNKYKRVATAQAETSKEIQDTKQRIQSLKEEPRKSEAAGRDSQETIVELEARLETLTATFAQLEEMKRQLAQEREKTSLLTKELEQMEKQERDLLIKLKHGPKTAPVIVVASPKDNSRIEANFIYLAGVAEDDFGLEHLEIFINQEPLKQIAGRGIKLKRTEYLTRIDFSERIPLQKGENQIRVRAVNSEGLSSEKVITVSRIERRRNVWAVVIGINQYTHIRQLKYAVNDARMFYDHLVRYNQVPAENVSLLLDKQATLTRMRSVLGTHLKNRAGNEDMVIIFFAGHGATEKNTFSPDGDGLEKYLLPFNADLNDLYE